MKFNYTNSSTENSNSWMYKKEEEITSHPAWHGPINGMYCEALLRNKAPFTYILRSGEERYHYYLSFVKSDINFKHQPFTIEHSAQGWIYRNGNVSITENLDEIIQLIMHCKKEECFPLAKLVSHAELGKNLFVQINALTK